MPDSARLILDVGRFWQSLQDDLLRAADLFPEDKLNWMPREGLWNARGILIHVADVRDQWLANGVQDGDPYPNIWQTARTIDDLKRELVRTYERLTRFITDATPRIPSPGIRRALNRVTGSPSNCSNMTSTIARNCFSASRSSISRMASSCSFSHGWRARTGVSEPTT